MRFHKTEEKDRPPVWNFPPITERRGLPTHLDHDEELGPELNRGG
jgi:hypothetical protein